MYYKAVITDIDGTLVQYRPSLSNMAEVDALIPERAILAVARLHQAGVAVAAVTGRTYDQSRDLLIKLGINEVLDKLSRVKNIYHVVNEGAGQANEVGLLVLSDGADKGSGTRSLLELLGVPREHTACVGDGANDVLMFNECGLSIAMGNGEEILKQSADHIVADIDQDGFAEAADYILHVAPSISV